MMMNFCMQSLFREYGWRFFRRIFLPHPLRTIKAMVAAGRLDVQRELVEIHGGELDVARGGARSIVGVGFCLKPMEPPCPSGRFNHDCVYLERLAGQKKSALPEPCRTCAIREIGMMARKAGAAFYIMTSARDILFDLYLPALKEGRFKEGLFVLCRYSFQPFAAGLMASGIRGVMVPFERGDCRDYATWLKADVGVKLDRTLVSEKNWEKITELIGSVDEALENNRGFRKEGNVFY